MAGGQAITVSQGFVTPDDGHGVAAEFSQGSLGRAITVALVGAVITLAQTSPTASTGTGSDLTLALIGHTVESVAGTASPAWGQALTGSESASAAGPIAIDMRPTNIVGQLLTASQGALTASGPNNVTVNLTGEEATFGIGIVGSGSQLLDSLVIAAQQGAPIYGFTLPLSGVEVATAQSSVAPNQDAVDVRIDSASGVVATEMAFALTGQAITSEQGALGISGDSFIPLAGEAITSAAGTIAHEEQYGLTGSEIVSALNSMGAPGGATLSGAVVSVVAGNVFTTNDRDFALTGQSITVSDGLAFASPLAFVAGLELTVSAQEIGPRVVALVGQEIAGLQSNVILAQGVIGRGFEIGGRREIIRLPRKKTTAEEAVETIFGDKPKEAKPPRTPEKRSPVFEQARQSAEEIIKAVAVAHAAAPASESVRFANVRTALKPIAPDLGNWNWVSVYQRLYDAELTRQIKSEMDAIDLAEEEAITLILMGN